jgi:hypothetical protein
MLPATYYLLEKNQLQTTSPGIARFFMNTECMRFTLLYLALPFTIMAQNYGPNSPSTAANVIGIGSLAWQNPPNIATSNDVYATVENYGTSVVTNYLRGTGFGFNLQNTDVVSGIQVEIEKSTPPPATVTLIDPWVVGSPRPLSAGNNRCMVVFIAQENPGNRGITSMTYGGQNLSLYSGSGVFYGFTEKLEMWIMKEAQLALVTGTDFVVTYNIAASTNNMEIIASAVYANIDQGLVFDYANTEQLTSGSPTVQLSTPITTTAGGMALSAIFSVDPPNPLQAIGNCNAFSVNSNFTEIIDYYSANPSIAGSGGVLEIAYKPITTTGSEQPLGTFTGAPSRWFIAGASLRAASRDARDLNVSLLKNGNIVGNNKATNQQWSATDTYTTYGTGILDKWGTTWLYSDINNPNFGVSLAAVVGNTQLKVDHMRILVYTTSVLPLELVYFGASQNGETVNCMWLTASELNTETFVIERSSDGYGFQPVGTVKAAGNSTTTLHYSFTDEHPSEGIHYYRLKMVDADGTTTYSDIVSVAFGSGTVPLLYPNPASDWTTVLTPTGFDEIVITNASGAIVDRIAGTSLETKQQLNVYDMPDGTYFICIKSADRPVEIRQLMKTSKTL